MSPFQAIPVLPMEGGNNMSKQSSGLFFGTIGSLKKRIIPGDEGIVTGGSSTALGRSILKSMGIRKKMKWNGYQAQHIIPKELASHPVLTKIGIHLDHYSNGIFLRSPSDSVSTLSRHRGYHAPYNEFVRYKLNNMDINDSTYRLQQEVYKLQNNLRKLQMSGVAIYPKYGATFESISRAYDRISR